MGLFFGCVDLLCLVDWHLRDLDVLELILADCPDGIPVWFGKVDISLFRNNGRRWADIQELNVQIPAATPKTARPVTAFLTRYGRRARRRAADWAFVRV